MLFDTPVDLARAFEAGPATAERWQKVVRRHCAQLGFDAVSVKAALTKPEHQAVAGA